MMKKNGFTLIELAVAILIISLLLVGLLGPLSNRIEQKDRQATQVLLEDIQQALLGFAISNGRLPCPDTDGDGQEDWRAAPPAAPNRVCGAQQGNLPWNDLGVEQEDSWGRPFIYAVNGIYARETNTAPCATANAFASFELCSVLAAGGMVVSTTAGGGGVVVANNVPAVVLSRGSKNDCSPLENENDDGLFCGAAAVVDQNFVFIDYNQTVGGEFDDLVIWISPNILNNRMVQAGRLP